MAMIKCPECNIKISEKANICPRCGYPINRAEILEQRNRDRQTKRMIRGFVAISLLVLVGFYAYVFISDEIEAKNRANQFNSGTNTNTIIENPVELPIKNQTEPPHEAEPTTKEEVVEQDREVWSIHHYNDAIGKPTNQQYISASGRQASNKSGSWAYMRIENGQVSFNLTYEMRSVDNPSKKKDKYWIHVYINEQEKHDFDGYMPANDDTVYVNPLQAASLIDLIKENENMYIIIGCLVDDYSDSFYFERGNFNEVYNSLNGEALTDFYRRQANENLLTDFENKLVGNYSLKYIKELVDICESTGDAKLTLQEDRIFRLSLYNISADELETKHSEIMGYWEYDEQYKILHITPIPLNNYFKIMADVYKDMDYDSEEIRNGSGVVIMIDVDDSYNKSNYYKLYFDLDS